MGAGQLGSFPETLIDPALGGYIPVHYFSRPPPYYYVWMSVPPILNAGSTTD